MGSDQPLGAEAAMITGAMQALALQRLCKTCKHSYKALTKNWSEAECLRPGLPVNLVNGERRFPCVIARGYAPLCGSLGVFWERK